MRTADCYRDSTDYTFFLFLASKNFSSEEETIETVDFSLKFHDFSAEKFNQSSAIDAALSQGDNSGIKGADGLEGSCVWEERWARVDCPYLSTFKPARIRGTQLLRRSCEWRRPKGLKAGRGDGKPNHCQTTKG